MALCFVTHSRVSAVRLPRAVEFGNIGIDVIGHKLSRDGPGNQTGAKATLADLRFVSLSPEYCQSKADNVANAAALATKIMAAC